MYVYSYGYVYLCIVDDMHTYPYIHMLYTHMYITYVHVCLNTYKIIEIIWNCQFSTVLTYKHLNFVGYILQINRLICFDGIKWFQIYDSLHVRLPWRGTKKEVDSHSSNGSSRREHWNITKKWRETLKAKEREIGRLVGQDWLETGRSSWTWGKGEWVTSGFHIPAMYNPSHGNALQASQPWD